MNVKQVNRGLGTTGQKIGCDRNLRVRLRKLVMATMALLSGVAIADITVSDVQVFSGHPWKEVVVGYTITGTDREAFSLRLSATDKDADKTYAATTLTGAELTEGRHILRWNAAADGILFSSTNVVFDVVIAARGYVQLWENGPYWAECNVGASKPEERGYYFWWGDTVGCELKRFDNRYEMASVKDGTRFSFCSENCPTYGKDNAQLLSAGYINSTGCLVAAHDAATAHLGALWRMPTDAELSALVSKCTATLTSQDGVSGWLITGKGAYASKSIFLPDAGRGEDSYCKAVGCGYWSSTPQPGNSHNALDLELDWNRFRLDYDYGYRYAGLSVRPIREFSK